MVEALQTPYRQGQGHEERERCGEVGRKWVLGHNAKMTSAHLATGFIESMDGAFDNWKPQPKYRMEVI